MCSGVQRRGHVLGTSDLDFLSLVHSLKLGFIKLQVQPRASPAYPVPCPCFRVLSNAQQSCLATAACQNEGRLLLELLTLGAHKNHVTK